MGDGGNAWDLTRNAILSEQKPPIDNYSCLSAEKFELDFFTCFFFLFRKKSNVFFSLTFFPICLTEFFGFFFLKLKSAENFFFLISSVWREIDKLCYTILTNLISFGHFEFGGVMNPEKLLIPQVVSLCD